MKVKVTLLSIESGSKKPSLDLDNINTFEIPQMEKLRTTKHGFKKKAPIFVMNE